MSLQKLFIKLGVDYSHIGPELRAAALTGKAWTVKIMAGLNSGELVDIAAMVPNGTTYRDELVKVLTMAYGACNLIGSSDPSAVKGILQRAGAEVTGIIHGKVHSMSDYVHAFEYVFNASEP